MESCQYLQVTIPFLPISLKPTPLRTLLSPPSFISKSPVTSMLLYLMVNSQSYSYGSTNSIKHSPFHLLDTLASLGFLDTTLSWCFFSFSLAGSSSSSACNVGQPQGSVPASLPLSIYTHSLGDLT